MKKLLLILVALIVVAGCRHLEKSYDDAVVNYEEYEEIYRTTKKINSDLCAERAIPDKDAKYAQFSKASQIAAMKKNLTRWIEEYNAKSRMVNRSIWRSRELPYQLTTNEFNCYGE